MNLRNLTLTLLLALPVAAQPRVGKSNIKVPLPPDPHELVTGAVQTPGESERGADLAIMQHALQNSRLMTAGMGPFRVDVSFSSTGQGADNGQGQFSQTWINGGLWHWTASLGNVSIVRGNGPTGPYAESANGVPMPIHQVRNAIFNPIYAQMAMGTQLRAADVKVNGQPATCMMTSGVLGPANYQGRLWEETEYCFDKASGRLVSSSIAAGTFTVFSYSKNLTLNSHTFSDASGTDPNSLAPTPQMVSRGVVMDAPSHVPVRVPAPSGVSKITPVIVHVNAVDGKVVSADVCASADDSLNAAAIAAVNAMAGSPGQQQQIYFSVKFVPGASN
jgi:hypothetical protein